MSTSFWDKVYKCKHDFYPDYVVGLSCETPYCSGWELHCRKCGVFVQDCDYGYNRGLSGWSSYRTRKMQKKWRNE